jgi:hypothetical protein
VDILQGYAAPIILALSSTAHFAQPGNAGLVFLEGPSTGDMESKMGCDKGPSEDSERTATSSKDPAHKCLAVEASYGEGTIDRVSTAVISDWQLVADDL